MRYLPLLCLLAGCFDALQAPREAVWYAPPAEYYIWWDELSACADSYYPLVAQFYRVPGEGAYFVTSSGKRAAGEWIPPHNIYVSQVLIHERRVVKHEMLHDILNGDPSHSSPLWQKCEVA